MTNLLTLFASMCRPGTFYIITIYCMSVNNVYATAECGCVHKNNINLAILTVFTEPTRNLLSSTHYSQTVVANVIKTCAVLHVAAQPLLTFCFLQNQVASYRSLIFYYYYALLFYKY